MPYIKDYERDYLDPHLGGICKCMTDRVPGRLNYAITRLLRAYIGEKPTYQTYNDVIGVLECAKLELYRRHVAKYEDRKRLENGDV